MPKSPGASRSSQDKVRACAIANGLPWELEAVLVADESGRLLSARNVLPNASEPLAEASETDRKDFVGLFRPEPS